MDRNKYEEMKKRYFLSLLGCCAVLFMFSACKKTEFMPTPEGEQVIYEPETTETVFQLLEKSTDASLFKRAWEKSTTKERLAGMGNTRYTLLVPNDAAMTASGITAITIEQMKVADVDSLVLFYTMLGQLRADQLKLESLPSKSMLERPGLFLNHFENPNSSFFDVYQYKHYLAVRGNELLINGKSKGNLNYKLAIDGGIYFMNATIEKPTKTAIEVLEDDERFTWFVEVMKGLDDHYAEVTIAAYRDLFGIEFTQEDFWASYSYLRERYRTIWTIVPMPNPEYARLNINISTLFAPTNDAFRNAGFTSVADILAFNDRRGDVRFDMDLFAPAGSYPMDTLLNYNRDWGRMFGPRDPSYGLGAANATVFFSNDLQSDAINNYYVNLGGSASMEYAYLMPFVFSQNNGRTQMKIKGVEQLPVNIVGGDINTLNGPIHVVDNLFLPKGFKLK
ncbi:Fasciclin domain protein [compost metagenome]